MNQFEYLLMFASVILALAVCDLAISMNRLLQAGKKVTWDWLAPLAAAVAFLKIVTQWWAWFGAESFAAGLTFGMFLSVLIGAMLLFLLVSTALPDGIEEAGIDLRDYYNSVSRRYWLLFVAHWVFVTATTLWIEVAAEHATFSAASLASPAVLIIPIGILLAFYRNTWLHTACLLGFIALYAGQSFTHTLH